MEPNDLNLTAQRNKRQASFLPRHQDRHHSPTTNTPLPSLPRRTRDVDDDAGDDAGDDAVHHQKTPVTTHLLLLSSPMRARQGLHSSPSWPRGLACRRPPSAVPAATDVHASAPFAPILFRSRERHARTLWLVTAVPATAIGSATITRPRSSA